MAMTRIAVNAKWKLGMVAEMRVTRARMHMMDVLEYGTVVQDAPRSFVYAETVNIGVQQGCFTYCRGRLVSLCMLDRMRIERVRDC